MLADIRLSFIGQTIHPRAIFLCKLHRFVLFNVDRSAGGPCIGSLIVRETIPLTSDLPFGGFTVKVDKSIVYQIDGRFTMTRGRIPGAVARCHPANGSENLKLGPDGDRLFYAVGTCKFI